MQYDVSQIRLIDVPQLERLAGDQCSRTYLYLFQNRLPDQAEIDQVAIALDEKFLFSKDKYDISEDLEISAVISIKRLNDHQAQVTIMTTQPEESCVYLFGIRRLPPKLESVFGPAQLIQEQPRDLWIR